jgi:mannose-6-phosphate isomerase-like protein (cupin superfamily)
MDGEVMIVKNAVEIKPVSAHNSTCILRTFFYKSNPLRSNILWINETVVEGGKTIEPHSHKSEEEIWYIIEGNGVMHIDNESRTVGPRDIIYTPPKHTHSITNNTQKPLRFINIGAKVNKFSLLYTARMKASALFKSLQNKI